MMAAPPRFQIKPYTGTVERINLTPIFRWLVGRDVSVQLLPKIFGKRIPIRLPDAPRNQISPLAGAELSPLFPLHRIDLGGVDRINRPYESRVTHMKAANTAAIAGGDG